MFVAHAPAGYLITVAISRGRCRRAALVAGTAGSLCPDLDMLWFYLVDHCRTLHHSYLTHRPAFWLAVGGLAFAATRWPSLRRFTPLVAAFWLNVLGHLVLDTVAGGVAWLWPWSPHAFVLVSVPAAHGHWIANFLLHWSFLLEVAILVAALAVWRSRGAGVIQIRGSRGDWLSTASAARPGSLAPPGS
jgi:inner membrane protein